MRNKAIVHIMSKDRMKWSALKADLDAIEELWEKYGINNIIFYKWEKIDYSYLISKLEKYWIYTQNYSNKKDLLEKIKKINERYEIIFVYTALELMIKTANFVRIWLNHVVSAEPNIFRDKSLQRKFLQENAPELGVKFLKWEPEKLDLKLIEKEIWYPFIMKPVNWVQSSGVMKVEKKSDFQKYLKDYADFHDRLKARWIENKELIIEEFIDGNLYTLDYFVTSEWKIIFSKPAQEILWIDFWVNDYFVVARVASKKVEQDLEKTNLKQFIEDTIKACRVRNTFVHHEFKLTTKWKLKTIELNGRFWGWRVDLFKEAYGMNLFEMCLNPNVEPWELKKNNIVFNICATKRWKLIWIDEKIFEMIKERPSVEKVSFTESSIGKEVWLTKDWFTKMWSIKLVSSNFDEINEDFEFIKSKYLDMLIIKTEEELEHEKNNFKGHFLEKLKERI